MTTRETRDGATRSRGKRGQEGINVRHRLHCASSTGGGCTCQPSYQAQVWSVRDDKQIRKTFSSLADAKAWRQNTQVGLRRGTMRTPSPTTVDEAATEWLAAARTGVIRTRSGDPYKPSAIRAYHHALNCHILPRLGTQRLTAITHVMLQDIADDLAAAGLSASTVRNAMLPLRAIYRRVLARGEVAVNPTLKLTLPAVRGRRDRIAPPQEATALLEALPLSDRAIWATALYAGLRLGELRALTWEHVDSAENIIHVERAWDPRAGFIQPKSRAGIRRVPITQVLRHHLLNHRLQQGTGGTGWVFPNTHHTAPFNPSTINDRAGVSWKTAGLAKIGLHECRHTYASFMIAAGVNTKALSTYMGHTSITITLDRYGHLLPGNEHHAAELLNTWLTHHTEHEPLLRPQHS